MAGSRISRKLALEPGELDDLMNSTWNMRIATVGPGNRINLTPLWFGWAGGRIYAFARGQKVANLRRDPTCTVLVDRNERFPELQGAMFQGIAQVLEDAEAEAADPFLDSEVRAQMGQKYSGGHGDPLVDEERRNESTARGPDWRWIVVTPERLVSWDNFKLEAIRRQRAAHRGDTP